MKILFINHSATRTGAPLVLLLFLRWLRQHETVEFDILTLQSGELNDQFSELAEKHYVVRKPSITERLFEKLVKSIGFNSKTGLYLPRRVFREINRNKYDLIYVNTVVGLNYGVFLKERLDYKPKLLIHFHELNVIIKQYINDLNAVKNHIDFAIAASGAVKSNLIHNYNFNSSKIEVVYEFSELKSKQVVDKTSLFIVGASGMAYWRKGTDIFILVAKEVFNILPEANIQFQWVGKVTNLNRSIFENDINKLNLENKVVLLGALKEPSEVFSNFDIFLMTSREDPFPLVCIEVGTMKIPIICFDKATGTQEVIKNMPNAVVPYLDINAMANKVVEYYKNRELLINDGEKMGVIFSEFNAENQCPKILSIIKDLC